MKEGTLTAPDLARIQIFSSWNNKQLAQLVKKTTLRLCHEHEMLYNAYTINPSLVIILDDRIEKTFKVLDETIAFDTLTKGDAWGSVSVLNPATKYPYGVRAASDKSMVALIKVFDVLKLIEREQPMLASFLHDIANYEAKYHAHYEKNTATLAAITALVHETRDSSAKMQLILKLIADETGARHALLARFEPASNTIYIEQSHGYAPSLAGTASKLSRDTVLSRIYASAKPFSVQRGTFEKKFSSTPYARYTMVVAPVAAANTVIGAVLVADAKNDADFLPSDQSFLTIAAQLLSGELSLSVSRTAERSREHLKRSYIGSTL